MAPAPYVMIVEDDAATREAMELLLGAAGHKVVSAANGREALDYLNAHPAPRLILLDLMMPVMDGWQFRQRQQGDPALAGIPVVVVSADADVGKKVTTLGAAGYLQKPIDFDELVGAVGRHA